MTHPVRADFFGMTDVGRVRPLNEDQFLIAELQKSLLIKNSSLDLEDRTRLVSGTQGLLLVVADGVGGEVAGDKASGIAVEMLTRYVLNTMPWFFHLDQRRADDLREELVTALKTCDQRVESAAVAGEGLGGMATTLTMAYLLWPSLYVVHAGDSRCYVFHDGGIEQITRDHTESKSVPVRLPGGAVTPRRIEVLWNVVGGGAPRVSPEVTKVSLEEDDVILLCTDGLTRYVSDTELERVLRQSWPAEEVCRHLIGEAKERGGGDNITCVVARLMSAAPGAP